MTTQSFKTVDFPALYGDDEIYVRDEDDRAAICGLPADAWPAVLEATAELTGGTPGDQLPGIDCGIAKTHETINDFDAARSTYWSEPGTREEHMFDGRRAVIYRRLQLRRGTSRIDQAVVDCGSCRAALLLG